jgi:glycosyltransferase involved in cell wall biosynthesis
MHVIDSLARGGAERMLVEIANRSIQEGYSVSVCVTRSETSLADSLNTKIRLFVLGRRRRFQLAPMMTFSKLVETEGIDLLHAHGRPTLSFLAFLKAAGLIKRPVVFHDHLPLEMGPQIPLWFRFLGKRSVDHYVGVYPDLAEWACTAGIPRPRVSIIENGLSLNNSRHIPSAVLKEKFGIEKDTLVGILVGRLDSQKGIDVLLDAIAVSRKGRNARVLIVGKDFDPAYSLACRAQSTKSGLDKSVSFVGEQSNISALLKAADFALLSSRYESGPLVLIEYMAAGLPFVATNVGGIASRGKALGVPGFVPPENPAAFSEALDQLLSLSTEQRSVRGELGRAVALKHFNIDNAMPQWVKVYDSAMSTGLQ